MVRATCDAIGTTIRKFNDYVRGELRRKHISQQLLADYLNLSRATITRKLNGEIEWSLREAFSVMEFLETSFKEL